MCHTIYYTLTFFSFGANVSLSDRCHFVAGVISALNFTAMAIKNNSKGSKIQCRENAPLINKGKPQSFK